MQVSTVCFFFFQAEDGIRDIGVTGVQTCALPIYEPSLHYVGEWWKQLYGESEGKDNKGIYPASVDFSTDLHSMGQYIQEGKRILFETVLNVEKPRREIIINEEKIEDRKSVV